MCVSIIIPTYNREGLIEGSVRSVLAQTYRNFEIILVDDCSTDGTPEVISSLVKEDRRCRYIRHDINIGAQAARQTGIKAAKGELIAFLDSDDEWYPEKLEKQVEAFKRLPAKVGAVHSGCDIYYESTGRKKRFEVPILNGYVYEKLLRRPGPLYPCLMVRRKCFGEIPDAIDPNVPSYQEWDTSINLARKYDFYFIDEPLMVYNIHKGETISSDLYRDIEGYLYVVKKHHEEILKHCGSEALGNHYCSMAAKYLVIKDYSRAGEFVKMAKEYGVRGFKNKIFMDVAAISPKLARRFLQFYITKIKKNE
jgi:glycosyltransferase involved in cell wall biosynthesis